MILLMAVARQRWFSAWCCLVKRVETRNHPYAMRYRGRGIDYEDSHWGPISERLCALTDWLTFGAAHD
jgi:hypothetical protein